MTNEEIIKDNILIAKWLGAVYINDAPEDFPEGYYMWKDDLDETISEYDLPLEAKDFEFHYDSNLQWLCLEKIAKNNNKTYSIDGVICYLGMNNSIFTKQDLFKRVVNYIKEDLKAKRTTYFIKHYSNNSVNDIFPNISEEEIEIEIDKRIEDES